MTRIIGLMTAFIFALGFSTGHGSADEGNAEGIITGHPGMPVFQFEPDQVTALIEHLHEISDKPVK